MKRSHLSLIVWLFICAIVLCTFLPILLINQRDIIGGERKEFVNLVKNWEVFFGEQPQSNEEWSVFDAPSKTRMSDYKGTVWLRRPLPKLGMDNPYLFLSGMNRFEVYLEGKQLYSFNMDGHITWNHYMMKFHPIRIGADAHDKELMIRMEREGLPFFGNDLVLAGEPDQLLMVFMQADMSRYIYSILYITAGVIGISLFARRKERLYLWFTMLTFSAGIGLLLTNKSLQWFFKVDVLYYWNDILLAFGVYVFTGLFAEVLGASRKPLIQITKNTLLLYTFGAFCAGIWKPLLYWKLLVEGLPFVVLTAMGVVTYAILRYSQLSIRQNERKWLLRGYGILVFCGLIHLLASLFPNLLIGNLLNSSYDYFYRIIESSLPNGLFLFMICVVMVIVNSVRRVHQESEHNAKELLVKNSELEQFHRNLEQLVEVRTKELEQANLSLSVSMREKAETLAEVSVLEERNRIAHEMHDVVGHTLTAAIVQLEATKKLAIRDGALPLDKLGIILGLVRKGLDDIRKTVRMLKSDKAPVKLEAALRELIRETIETMEVAIDSHIEIPSGLGRLTEQVLYHALQEGLTNGIRHAGCSWFRYTLRPVEESLEFRLCNDGKPFGSAKPGFGLTSMMERVHLLGGTVDIRSGQEENGVPVGCELTITLPLYK